MKLNELKLIEDENENLPPMQDGFFTKKVDIAQWIEKYVGDDYTINDDKSVSVRYDVRLHFHSGCGHPQFGRIYPSGHLPIRFSESQDFEAANNKLTSMEGFPVKISGDFDAQQNEFTSFEHSPKFVSGDYDIRSNPGITSFVGIANHIKHIGGVFTSNLIDITEGGLGILNIDGVKDWRTTVATGLIGSKVHQAYKIILKHIASADRDIFECQSELIEAGLDEFAKL